MARASIPEGAQSSNINIGGDITRFSNLLPATSEGAFFFEFHFGKEKLVGRIFGGIKRKLKHDDRERHDGKYLLVRGQIFRDGEIKYRWSVEQAATVELLHLGELEHVNDGGGGGGDSDGSSKDWRKVKFSEESGKVKQEPSDQPCQAEQHDEKEGGDGDEGLAGGEEEGEKEASLPLPAHAGKGGVEAGDQDGGRGRHRGAGGLGQPSS